MSTIPPPSQDEILDKLKAELENHKQLNPYIYLDNPELPMLPSILEPREMLGIIRHMVNRGTLPVPTWAMVACDSYHYTGQAGEGHADHPSNLGEAFAKGDPNVTECLMVTFMSSEDRSYAVMWPYLRVGSDFVWSDVQDMSDSLDMLGGTLPTLLREIVGLQVPEGTRD